MSDKTTEQLLCELGEKQARTHEKLSDLRVYIEDLGAVVSNLVISEAERKASRKDLKEAIGTVLCIGIIVLATWKLIDISVWVFG